MSDHALAARSFIRDCRQLLDEFEILLDVEGGIQEDQVPALANVFVVKAQELRNLLRVAHILETKRLLSFKRLDDLHGTGKALMD